MEKITRNMEAKIGTNGAIERSICRGNRGDSADSEWRERKETK